MNNQKNSQTARRLDAPRLSDSNEIAPIPGGLQRSFAKNVLSAAEQDPAYIKEMRDGNNDTAPAPLANATISLAIVDKSTLFRTGLISILAGSRFRIFASCADLGELSKRIAFEKPRVVVLTVDQEAGLILAQAAKLIAQDIRVLILSERFRPEEAFAAIEAGVDGYLLKNEIHPDALLTSLELVCLQGVVLPHGFGKLLKESGGPEIMFRGKPPENAATSGQEPAASPPPDELARLSNRERMILAQLTQGASNKQIARELNIAEATVKVYVKNLLRKIRVENRTQAAIWAIGNKAALGICVAICGVISIAFRF